MTRRGVNRMRLALTRGEAQTLHEEIGDIPKSRVGPKLLSLYRELDEALAIEWTEQNLRQQQRRGARL